MHTAFGRNDADHPPMRAFWLFAMIWAACSPAQGASLDSPYAHSRVASVMRHAAEQFPDAALSDTALSDRPPFGPLRDSPDSPARWLATAG